MSLSCRSCPILERPRESAAQQWAVTPKTGRSHARKRNARFGPGCLSMSPPRYNKTFHHWSGRDLPGRRSLGGTLNQFGETKMGVWDQSASSSVSSHGAWTGAGTATGGGSNFGNDANKCSSGLIGEEASVEVAQVGTHASLSTMPNVRRPKPNLSSKKVNVELDFPQKPVPKNTCGFTSLKSRRVRVPSCVIRTRRLIGLRVSKKRYEMFAAQPCSKPSGAVARSSCTLLGGSSLLQSNCAYSSFSLAKSVKQKPGD